MCLVLVLILILDSLTSQRNIKNLLFSNNNLMIAAFPMSAASPFILRRIRKNLLKILILVFFWGDFPENQGCSATKCIKSTLRIFRFKDSILIKWLKKHVSVWSLRIQYRNYYVDLYKLHGFVK